MYIFDYSREFDPGHVGHGLIRDDRVPPIRLIPKKPKRFAIAIRCCDVVAKTLKEATCDIRNRRFVIDEKNAAAASDSFLLWLSGIGGLPVRRGQVQADTGPAT